MEVGIGAGDAHRFVPDQRMGALLRRPVELAEHRFALRVHEAERVHAETLHRAVAARDGAIRHRPQQHVRGFGHQRHEIPERVVRRGGLRHRVVRLGLQRVHEVRKLHRVLDEEHGDVVADQVPVALVGVELDREATDVARGVGRSALARDGREPYEHRCDLAGFGEHRSTGHLGQRLVVLEESVARPIPAHGRFAPECARGRSA